MFGTPSMARSRLINISGNVQLWRVRHEEAFGISSISRGAVSRLPSVSSHPRRPLRCNERGGSLLHRPALHLDASSYAEPLIEARRTDLPSPGLPNSIAWAPIWEQPHQLARTEELPGPRYFIDKHPEAALWELRPSCHPPPFVLSLLFSPSAILDAPTAAALTIDEPFRRLSLFYRLVQVNGDRPWTPCHEREISRPLPHLLGAISLRGPLTTTCQLTTLLRPNRPQKHQRHDNSPALTFCITPRRFAQVFTQSPPSAAPRQTHVGTYPMPDG